MVDHTFFKIGLNLFYLGFKMMEKYNHAAAHDHV